MFKSLLSNEHGDLLSKLSASITSIAIISGLILRKTKTFKAEVFLLAFAKSVAEGKPSFNKIVMQMHTLDKNCSITPQALWKRLTRSTCSLEQFIIKCSAKLFAQQVPQAQKHKRVFTRILTEDSSFVKMMKACAEIFPAHGNKHGATAGVKLNMIFDLITGEPIEFSTHEATQQDRTIAWDVLDWLKKGDLVLRDRGYFNVKIFAEIQKQLAHWLSRVPSSVKISFNKDQEIETLLETTTSDIVDRQVTLTDSHFPARVTAIRKSEQQAQKDVRSLKEQYLKKGKQPSKKALIRARWHILVSSIPQEIMTPQDLGKLYSQRWQIEIIFKAWKQSSNLEKALNKKSNVQHMLGIFLVDVFRLHLAMLFYQVLRISKQIDIGRLSIAKLCDWISTSMSSAKTYRDLMSQNLNITHIYTQTRKRNSQINSMLELLG